jgi:DCN1-like protein 1/2
MEEMASSNAVFLDSVSPHFILNSKRSRLIDYRPLNWEDNPHGNSASDGMDITKQNNSLGSMKSPCAVEGCLSRGFAGLFSTRSYLQLDRERRVSYT